MTQAKTVVAVVDYGMGNLHSVAKAVEHVAPHADVKVSSDPKTILQSDRVIFPGVGAIRDCMGEIKRLGLDEVIIKASQSKPLLAICIGMQALMTRSEENNGVDCLNVFSGQVRFFGDDLVDNYADSQTHLKVPHMGWNEVSQVVAHPIWAGIPQQTRFYFVHSYYVEPAYESEIAGTVSYGKPFAAAIYRDNIVGVQFHPEKSHIAGLRLLENFMNWNGSSGNTD